MKQKHSEVRAARRLPAVVRQYLQASLSENTRRAYGNDIQQYHRWGGRIPSSPERVAKYLAANANLLSPSTLARHVVSIGKAHEACGWPSPARANVVRATLQGIRRVNGSAQRRVAPVALRDLQAMVRGLHGVKGLRDKALLLTGFAGAFRRSELVSIRVEDIAFVRRGMVVHLTRGKTDQLGNGRKVPIPYMRGNICPVKAMKTWLREAGLGDGPVFRQVNRHGSVLSHGISPQSVALIVKERANAIGLNADEVSGHSLRAGLVTAAARSGASAWKIRQQTGHQSDAMLQLYIRESDLFNGHPLTNVR